MQTTITRQRLFNGTGSRVPFSWVYSYTSPVEQRFTRPDGTEYVIAVGQRVEFGKGLASVRDMLRHKFGPGIKITETWKD